MMFRALPPPPALAAVVGCLWVRQAGAGEAVLVLPDGCVDVVVRDGCATVAGPDTGPVESVLPAGAVVAGGRVPPRAAGGGAGGPRPRLRAPPGGRAGPRGAPPGAGGGGAG